MLRLLNTNLPLPKRSKTEGTSSEKRHLNMETQEKENYSLQGEREGSISSDCSVQSDSLEREQKQTTPEKESCDGSQRKRERSTSSDKSSDYTTPCASPDELLKGNKGQYTEKDSRLPAKYQKLQNHFRKHRHETRIKLRDKDNEICSLKKKLERTQSRLRKVKKYAVQVHLALQPDTDSSVSPAVSPKTNKGRWFLYPSLVWPNDSFYV